MGLIILECLVLSLAYWLVYHIWFSSKDNQLIDSGEGGENLGVIDGKDLEEEGDTDQEELIDAMNEMIKKEVITSNDMPVDTQGDFTPSDEEVEGEGDTYDTHEEYDKKSNEDENSKMENKTEALLDDSEAIDELPTIDYLKQS